MQQFITSSGHKYPLGWLTMTPSNKLVEEHLVHFFGDFIQFLNQIKGYTRTQYS
jgi:hypothetical protein